MKSIIQFLQESIKVNKGSIFSEKLEYTLSEWNDWKTNTTTSQNIDVYEDTENGLFTVYMNDEYIATYLVKDQILLCDNKKLFNK